jgi:hypothetical protein
MAGERSFAKLGASRADLESAWQDRLKEAEILLQARRPAAAMAAAFYTLEIFLKVLICRRLDLPSLPKAFEIHDLESLLTLAGLSQKLKAKGGKIQKNWESVCELVPLLNDLRYSPEARWTQADAEKFFDQLTHPKTGLLAWLTKVR